jgi:hypothetical protein
VVKLVDQGLLRVDQLVDDLHERRNRRGTGLVDLLKDLAVLETFLVAVDDLVVVTPTQVLRFSKNRLV